VPTQFVTNPRRSLKAAPVAVSGSTRPTSAAEVGAYLRAHGMPGVTLRRERDGVLFFAGKPTEAWEGDNYFEDVALDDYMLDEWLVLARLTAAGDRVYGSDTAPTSDAFKKWFGKSKVVDSGGEPLVVYHGTMSAFDTFDPQHTGKNTWQKVGFSFSSDLRTAATYGNVILPVYLSLQNPLVIDAKGNYWRHLGEHGTADTAGVVAKEKGYDGIIVRNVGDANAGHWPETATTYVAFYPTQIKSAKGNAGTFSSDDPNIYKNPRRKNAPTSRARLSALQSTTLAVEGAHMPTQFITNPRRYPDTTSFAKRMGLPSPFFLDSHGMPYQVVPREQRIPGAVNFGPTDASLPRPDLRDAAGYRRKDVVLDNGDVYSFLVKASVRGRSKVMRRNRDTAPSLKGKGENLFYRMSGDEVASGINDGSLYTTIAKANDQRSVVTLATTEPRRAYQAKWFVSTDRAEEFRRALEQGGRQPASANLLLGPEDAFTRDTDTKVRSRAKDFNIEIAETTMYLNPRSNPSTPSAKRLADDLGISSADAKTLKKKMDAESVEDALAFADKAMNGFGVEYIASSEDTMRTPDGLDYVNMGDTYDTTLVYDHGKGKYLITSWGDIVEADMRLPRKRQRFAY